MKPAIHFSADALSKQYNISVGGVKGVLHLPSLPAWQDNERDPLDKHLLSPKVCENWRAGDDPVFWGKPCSYPNGISEVHKFYIDFQVNDIEDVQKVYQGYSRWKRLIYSYVKITSGQLLDNYISENIDLDFITIFENEDEFKRIEKNEIDSISIVFNMGDNCINFDKFGYILEQASNNVDLKLEYLLMLNALEARSKKDYRMAIIDSANSIEICLHNKIVETCKSRNIEFFDQLLNKYKMLGGKIELAKMLKIVEDKNYNTIINEPRNKVMHSGYFPSKLTADDYIKNSFEMLKVLQPIINEENV